MIDFKGSQPEETILPWKVKRRATCPIAHQQAKETMGERGVVGNRSTPRRRVITSASEIEKKLCRRQHLMSWSWRPDKTYGKMRGKRLYLRRPVNKAGYVIHALLTPNRDQEDAEAFLRKAVRNQRQFPALAA